MKYHDAKGALINGTISVIANNGLDKTTTKAIANETDITEAYIYRYFQDKENLLSETFSKLDDELASRIIENLPIMNKKDLDFETRSWFLFVNIWKFLMGNRDKCLAFIRYYYSPYFMKHSYSQHKRRYEVVEKEFRKVFKKDANVWMILNHIMSVMFDFSIKVFNGAVKNDDDTVEHVFRLIYKAVSQYFIEAQPINNV